MKRLSLILAVLAAATAPAWAGPNAGGVLVLHDTGLTYTLDSTSDPSPPPIDCQSIDTQLPSGPPPDGSAGYVWKVYAVFPPGSSPRLKAFTMGERVDTSVQVLAGGVPNPATDFEIAQNGWPSTTGGGVGVSFLYTKSDLIDDCYWLAGYSYTASGIFALAQHPVDATEFVDDAVPAHEDLVAGFGSIGFGVPGFRACPGGGACCLPNGDCAYIIQSECQQANGQWLGSLCNPNSCPQPYGACCFVDGHCTYVHLVDCNAAYGQWQGVPVPCIPNPCPQPYGACCFPNGSCLVLFLEECGAQGGTFHYGPVSCAPDPCGGPDFFSVEVGPARLVRVSSATGLVTPLGPLGREVGDVDLAYSGGWLWALNDLTAGPVELLKIDPTPYYYEVVSVVLVTLDGQPVTTAEGLAAFDGHLLISFQSSANTGRSHSVGELAESGAVTLLHNYMDFDMFADGDGLTAQPDGRLLWTDNNSPYSRRLIDVAVPPTQSYTVLGSTAFDNVNDIDLRGNGELWGIDHVARRLVRLRPDGAILQSVAYNAPIALYGLVVGPWDPNSGVEDGSVEAGNGRAPVLRAATGDDGGVRFTWPIATPGTARLEIFDTAGRHVRTLLDGRGGGGENTVLWDGRDACGQQVVQGIYFAWLSTRDARACVKAVIVR